jgi:predicted secreted hydrolase
VRLLAASLAAAAIAVPQLAFPRDHYGHRAGIEWWYFSADVHGSNGHRYAVFFTLFKRAGFLLPVSQVVNLDTGAIVRHTESLVPGTVGSSGLNVAIGADHLRYEPARNAWVVTVRASGYSLAFDARPLEPYVLHGGGTGVIRQGTSTSRYYSAARMSTRGSVKGSGTGFRFQGTAWFDHQWGAFADTPSALRWDWFSCRFDDRTELMLYRFRDGRANGTFVDRTGHGTSVRRFVAAAGPRVLRAKGRSWPLDWKLRVQSPKLELALHAIVPDQLVRGVLLPTFWEGAATVTGTKRGVCFVEETS